jgi:glucokinase
MAEQILLGFDIGGTKCATILASACADEIHIIERVTFATETAPGPEAALRKLEALAQELLVKHSVQTREVAAVGISCGGPLDSRRGVILSPPNLPGWNEIAITQRLQSTLGVPAFLQNDANACALAEWQWGAGRGCETMIFLTFGTGMGAGLIIGGRLHAGRDDLAGEAGHWRMAADGPVGFYKAGSFEGFCSGGGLARLAQTRFREAWMRGESTFINRDEAELAALNGKMLAGAARAGDKLACDVFKTCGHYLGSALALMIDFLNPEAIVIGSIFARCEDLLRGPMQEVLERETLPAALERCRVLPAQLGEQIGDYAALAVARAGVRGNN